MISLLFKIYLYKMIFFKGFWKIAKNKELFQILNLKSQKTVKNYKKLYKINKKLIYKEL